MGLVEHYVYDSRGPFCSSVDIVISGNFGHARDFCQERIAELLNLLNFYDVFKDFEWIDHFYHYFRTGKIDIDKRLCRKIRGARYQWWKDHSPPGYPYNGTKKTWERYISRKGAFGK